MSNHVPAFAVLRFVCALTIAASFAGHSVAQGRPSAQEAHKMLERYMGYFVRDGGRWLASNPAYEPGSRTPKARGYEFRWALDKTLVKNTIYGIYEDGARRDFAETVFTWNPVIGKVDQFLFVNGGGTGRGVENHLKNNVIEAELLVSKSLYGPAVRLKDWVKITGPDSFANATYQMDEDGKWALKAGSEATYERQSAGATP